MHQETSQCDARTTRSRSGLREWLHSSPRQTSRLCAGFGRGWRAPPVLFPCPTRRRSTLVRWWVPSAQSAGADDHAAGLKLFLVFEVLTSQTLGVDGIFQDDEGALDGERLLEEVESPQFGGTHCGLNVPMARNHNDFGWVRHLDDALQRFESVDAGQPDVEQYDIDWLT